MKVIHKNGFSHLDFVHFQEVLRSNCLESMQALIRFCGDKIKFSGDLKKHKNSVLEATILSEDVASSVAALWEDEELKEVFDNNINNLQIPTSSPYYFENAVRFAYENYKPSEEDILRAKLKTTGISDTVFELWGTEFTLVDVGGQRAERRKWIHCFNDVTAIIYLTALDEYNMTLQEDITTNRLKESLDLFRDITGSQWFQDKPCVLFLNKKDIFEEKIKKHPLKEYYPEAEGDLEDYDRALEFIESLFKGAYAGKSQLYKYDTCALDTTNCETVFRSVRDAIVQQSMGGAGF